ncbi:MAG TPA: hypothetical protein VI483_00725 [Candidatus Paceibacterota bacterium]
MTPEQKIAKVLKQIKNGRDIPLGLKWVVAIVAILAFVWGVYIYFNPKWQTVPVVSSANMTPNRSNFSTTTPDLLDIYNRAFSYDILADRQDFFKKYIHTNIYGDGTVREISKLSDKYILEITIGDYSILCPQELTENFERSYPLLKGKSVRFYGVFTYSTYFGYSNNQLVIDPCSFERK